MDLPENVDVLVGGSSSQQADDFTDLFLIMLVSIGIVFLIMVITFKSIKAPIAILCSLPLAAIGAILGILISGIAIALPLRAAVYFVDYVLLCHCSSLRSATMASRAACSAARSAQICSVGGFLQESVAMPAPARTSPGATAGEPAVAVGLVAVVRRRCGAVDLGFGSTLLSVPLMALLIDAKDAVVLATMFGLASSTVLVTRAHRGVVWPVAGHMLAGAAAGMPLGLLVLIAIDERVLRLIIAVAVIVLTGAAAGRGHRQGHRPALRRGRR